MAPTQNGNGRWTLATVVGVIGFVSGMAIGTMGTLAEARANFVSKTDYREDKRELTRHLNEIEGKVDRLLIAVERNSTELRRSRPRLEDR